MRKKKEPTSDDRPIEYPGKVSGSRKYRLTIDMTEPEMEWVEFMSAIYGMGIENYIELAIENDRCSELGLDSKSELIKDEDLEREWERKRDGYATFADTRQTFINSWW